jgi:hypothetical protein
MIPRPKQQRIEAIELAFRGQIDRALASNPGATFSDVMSALQTAVTRDVETKPGDAPVFLLALVKVVQHYHSTLTIEGSIRE